ncbi:MAG TPA: ketose-bisphosphate aldolase [Clostridiaceae bacterium]|jgi:fructose-bisphosphate aldolase class II|nr:ketose-bisphosphate aldolase [Clostridiaceae bacterium]
MLINMTELLSVAERFDFAVPAFNIGTGQLLKAVMDTCEALNAPVILAIHPEELKFQGDAFAAQCLYAAHHSRVPCVIHMDHGDKIEDMLKAIRLGFTSVMIDASHLPFEQNVAITKQVVALAHPLNISVEAELGTIGSTEGDMEKASGEIIYTDPGMAAEFVRLTDCDCLAIAIGTAHGIYPKGFVPELKLDLLSEIKGQVSVPLVLHGGSSNSDAEIAESIRRGVRKINISSDVKDAYYQELRLTLRDLVVREPFALYPASMQAAKRIIKEKIELFNAQDKIKHYKD